MNGTLQNVHHEDSSSNGNTTAKLVDWTWAVAKRTKMKKACKTFFFLCLNMQTFDFLVAAVVVIREFKIYDTTVAKT